LIHSSKRRYEPSRSRDVERAARGTARWSGPQGRRFHLTVEPFKEFSTAFWTANLMTETQQPPPLDLSWKTMTIQWGTRAPVRKDAGLTLGAINVGAYGEVPDYWQDRSRSPRGAYNPTGAAAASIGGYYLRHKSDVWADNAAELYEEAISRRWSSADSIPWDTCRGLPDDVELAVCQVATELSQQASVEAEVISGWQQHMSYAFHQFKLFL